MSLNSKAVEPLLVAITWSKCFLYDFLSVSLCCGGILAHCSLQRCFSSLRFTDIYLYTALSSFCYSISVRLRSGLWLGLCNTSNFFFFSYSDLLLCKPIAVRETPSHLALIVFCSDEFMVDSDPVRCPGPVAVKTSTSHHHSTSWCYVLLPNISTLNLSVQSRLLQKSCDLFRTLRTIFLLKRSFAFSRHPIQMSHTRSIFF